MTDARVDSRTVSKKATTSSPLHSDSRQSSGPGFEESLEQLESIIERIETGQVGLEAAIAEYEKGVGLLRRCRDILKRAEQRVEELNREAAGASEASPGANPGSPARHADIHDGPNDDPEHED